MAVFSMQDSKPGEHQFSGFVLFLVGGVGDEKLVYTSQKWR